MRALSCRLASTAALALCLISSDTVQAQGQGNGKKTPPGLAKKGGLPPGQAKKRYRPDEGVVILRDVFGRHGYTVVRVANQGETRYVYYRFKNGALRRAVVSPGTEQVTYTNVPAALLREVLAAMTGR